MTANGTPRGADAPRGIPALPSEQGLANALRDLLPERSPEDRAAGEISVAIGLGKSAKPLRIPVLFARANREWKDAFVAAARGVLDDLEQDATGASVLNLLTGLTDKQLDLLAVYSPDKLAREWVEDHATEEQILDVFLQVTAAAFPFPAKIASAVLGSRDLQAMVRLFYLGSMSSSPPSTDGPTPPSKTH